jgi:spore germination cell wall hydrolase CwlJ-like protein
MAGSALGLGLAAAYMAGANSTTGLTHVRARQLAAAEAQGFTDAALQRAGNLAPGVLAIAQRHDPFTVTGAAERDRQSADFAARLESADASRMGPTAASLMLRPELGPEGDHLSGRFRFASVGALNGARDLDCLTQAVYYEARGESAQGQAAVAQVVLNRVRHPAFPKTICGVVFQGAGMRKTDCQFSFVCDGSMRANRDVYAWDKAQHVAARALSGVTVAGIGGATHFHASRLTDQWGDGLVKVAQVGLHVFYKFGHNHAPFQAQLFEAAADAVTPREPADAKPVLASLLPTPSAEPSKAETKAETVKEAPAESPKPVAQTKSEPSA